MKEIDHNTVIVHAWLNGCYVPAGKLRMTGRLVEFWYGNHYLEKGYALDPLKLPLTNQVFYAEGLQASLGVFGDALPDSWGRYIIKRHYEHSLSELEMLLIDSSRQRMGALFFSRKLDLQASLKFHDLEWMGGFSEWINDHSMAFPEHLEYGSSAGGAKPKCLVYTDNQHWIAKFQAENEPVDKPAIEHGTLKLASACGIPVPESRLLRLPNDKHTVLIKRFDRQNEQAIHYLSGYTLCGVQTKENGEVINDTRSYLVFADALSKFSSQAQNDKRDLFRRIVFNILINNRDDHAKNHAVIRLINGSWQLSPAFDLVAGEGGSRNLAMLIGPEGNKASFSNLLQSIQSFGLEKKEAINDIITMLNNIKNWKKIFSDAGVHKKTISDIEWAIQDNIDVSRL